MSYYIELSIYKDIVEEKDLFRIAYEFCRNQYQNHMHDTLKDHLEYMPFYNDMHENMRIYDFSRATCAYLNSIFTYKFIYWKKYKLLGIAGQYSKTDNNFHDIVFQNSTDKDQNYDYWAPLRTLKPIIEKVRNGSSDDLVRKYFIENKSYIPEEINENLKSDIDYYRKTYIAEILEEKLCILNILFNHECDDIIMFRFASIIDDIAIKKETIAVINEWFAEINEYEKKKSDRENK